MGTTYGLLGLAWVMLSAGIYLLLSGRPSRDGGTLTEHLQPYHHSALADEADAWLKRQG